MPHLRGRSRRGALLLAGLIAAALPAHALSVSASGAFSKVERGRWLLRNADEGAERAICFGDPVAFVQIEHRGARCTHEVIANDGAAATVQYSCPGRGYGHTSIRVETSKAVLIDTQGLVDGRPFSHRLEARKIGAC